MKRRMSFTLLAVLFILPGVLFIFPKDDAHAGVAIDISFFYNELAPYGDWVSIDPYGWVWCPFNVNPGWRPYSDGYWVYTDCGWTWMSDVEWGWAAYHYGRWFYDDMYGWAWVPGTVWGPAWVAWRYGDGYVGWAPLPPDVRWMEAGGLDWGRFDFDVGFQWYWWNFTDERWLCKPKLRDHLYSSERNMVIIRNTQNITKYTFVNNRIMDQGLDVDRFEQATRQKIQRLVITEPQSSDKNHVARTKGNSLLLFRPQISKATAERTPPSVAHKPFNYGAYSRKLSAYHEQQIKKLEKQHEEMIKKAGPGVSKDEIAKNHQQAIGAVQEHQKREMQVFENRAKREQERTQSSREPRKSGGKRRR